jgi:two-component system nitrogen regulation sensor histidine kinase NtrY
VFIFFSLVGWQLRNILLHGLEAVSSLSLIILIAVVALLILMVGVNVYTYLYKRATQVGSPLRIQLVAVFSLMVITASIPQSVLALNILQVIMDQWVGESLEETLEASSEHVLDYYGTVSHNLQELGRSQWFLNEMDHYNGVGTFPWGGLKELNSLVDSLQILSPDNSEIYGNESLELESKYAGSYMDSFLPVRTRNDRVIIGYILERGDYRFILSSALIGQTGDLGRELDAQLDRLQGYNIYTQDQLRWRLYYIILFVFPLLLISINMAILFSNRLIYPVQELGQALKKVTEGDYTFRISEDDFGIYDFYVDIFNEMIDELNNSRSDLVQTEKIGVWRDIAQRLAHEIRNPLTPIKLSAQRILIKASDMDEETQRYLLSPMNRILKEVEELDLLLREFREFAGQRAPVYVKSSWGLLFMRFGTVMARIRSILFFHFMMRRRTGLFLVMPHS